MTIFDDCSGLRIFTEKQKSIKESTRFFFHYIKMLSPGTFYVISIAVDRGSDRTKLIIEVTKLLKNNHRQVIVDITA